MAYPQPWYIQNQKDIQNPDIFATLVYSEPCYIQQAGIFKIRGIFRTLSNIYNEALIINGWMVNGCIYFCSISLSRSLPHEINIMNFFNTGLIFTLEVVILCRKLRRARGSRTVNFRFAGNSSFGLGKQSSRKSLTRLPEVLCYPQFFKNIKYVRIVLNHL